MKNIKYLLLIFIALFTFNVYAEENDSDTCSNAEFARLKELAKKVDFDYEYRLENDVAVFSINAYNLNSDLKVLIIDDYYSGKYKEFKDNDSHSNKLDGFKAGERVVITIKGFVENRCSGKTVFTRTIKLPYYNVFYDEEACKGNEGFKYCKLLIDSNITEKSFYSQLAQYEKEKNASTPTEKVKQDDNNLVLIIGLSVMAAIVIVVVVLNIIKVRKKNRL